MTVDPRLYSQAYQVYHNLTAYPKVAVTESREIACQTYNREFPVKELYEVRLQEIHQKIAETQEKIDIARIEGIRIKSALEVSKSAPIDETSAAGEKIKANAKRNFTENLANLKKKMEAKCLAEKSAIEKTIADLKTIAAKGSAELSEARIKAALLAEKFRKKCAKRDELLAEVSNLKQICTAAEVEKSRIL